MVSRRFVFFLFITTICATEDIHFFTKKTEELISNLEESCKTDASECSRAGAEFAELLHVLQELLASFTHRNDDLEKIAMNSEKIMPSLLVLQTTSQVEDFKKNHIETVDNIVHEANRLLKNMHQFDRELWLQDLESLTKTRINEDL